MKCIVSVGIVGTLHVYAAIVMLYLLDSILTNPLNPIPQQPPRFVAYVTG